MLPPPPAPSAPDTTITTKPKAKTADRTPTFKFESSVAGATFECKLDGKALTPCRSPLTTKSLSFGRHTLKVAAIAGGLKDATPASSSFKVVKPRRGGGRRPAIRSVALAIAISALSAQAAFATFHEMVVREVYPGSASSPESEYVELQMYAPGQSFVGGHVLGFYNAAGAQTGTAKFLADVSNGANQSTILIATPAAESTFRGHRRPEHGAEPARPIRRRGLLGSARLRLLGEFQRLGQISRRLAGVSGIPDGQALRRTIAPGCASLLEPSDDRDNSALDFEVVFPGPRPNSVVPTEHACAGQGGGGPTGGGGTGGGGKNAPGAPQTTLKGKLAKRTRDRTPTFRFGASDDSASFQCKVDGKPFKACRSPFTTKRLPYGKHTFRVRARDASQATSTPPRHSSGSRSSSRASGR